MRRAFCVVSVALSMAGCASAQLNYNTLDLASSTDRLLTKQVNYNLANFIESPIAIPAQVVIAAGTASTTNAVSPSVTFPLSSARTVADALTGSAKGLTSTVTRAASGAALDATDVWSQNWALRPITNPEKLQRLQALYRFAVDGDEHALIGSFPLITKTVHHSRAVCVTNQYTGRCVTLEDTGKGRDPGGTDSGKPARENRTAVTATGLALGSGSATAGADAYSTEVPDEYYLTGPGCIVCLRPGARSATAGPGGLQVNPVLKGRWLHWRGPSGSPRADTVRPGDIFLGREGRYELYVDGGRPDAYVRFVAATLAASTQSQTAGGGAGGGAGGFISSGGRRGDETVSDLSAPTLQPALTIPIE